MKYILSLVIFLCSGFALSQTPPSSVSFAESLAEINALAIKATKARALALANGQRSGYEIDITARSAMNEAAGLFKDNGPASVAISSLERSLTGIYPLDSYPSVLLHKLLSALYERDGNISRAKYHANYSVALLKSLADTGDGKTALTAMKPISLSEEHAWFDAAKRLLTPKSRRLVRGASDESFDVWQVQLADGSASEVFFNVTELMASQSKLSGMQR